MKGWQIAALGVVAVLLLGFGGCSVVQYKNYAVRTENALQAQYDQNQNNYSTFTNSVVEILQVGDVQKDAVKEVVQASMQGRYGKDGSKAVFQWLHENNVQFDQSAFQRAAARIEAGRKDFEQNQKILIDMVRVYKTDTDPDNWPKGLVLSSLGFPRKKLEDFKIVTSEKTKTTFATGVDNAMDLKKK